MRNVFALLLLYLVSLPALAQEQDATMTPQERLKRMRAVEGRLPENVVTSFGRRAVDSHETPWRAVGRVNVGGRAHCTGTLVADNLVLTAAHCTFHAGSGQPVKPYDMHFVAGYSKGEYLAHSLVKSYVVPKGFDIGREAKDPVNWPNDWALLVLSTPIGATTGHISLHPELAPDAALTATKLPKAKSVITAGYPGDRAHVLSLEEDCSILDRALQDRVLLTSCLSLGGDSGGPILQKLDDGYVVIGVVTASRTHEGRHTSIGVSALSFREKLGQLLAAKQ